MSKGLRAKELPQLIQDGIKSAFDEWKDMSGDWLNSAPEYLVSVHIAQKIRAGIEPGKRTIFLEPSVSETLTRAGAVQPGPNAAKLRASGRYDIVVGQGNFRPRAVIEVKSPMIHPMHKSMINDLNRLCRTLLQKKKSTQIHSALMAIYVPSRTPNKIDISARDRLQRKWLDQLPQKLKDCDWAKRSKKFYSTRLNFKVHATIYDHQVSTEKWAWGSVCIEITRKTPAELTAISKKSV